jgi:hypothetical protein
MTIRREFAEPRRESDARIPEDLKPTCAIR